MGRRTQLGPNNVPELLRTHPVTSARIAESKDRASHYPPVEPAESLSYALMKERVRVLTTPAGVDPRDYYSSTIVNEPDASTAQVYGRALAQVMAGDSTSAIPALERLRATRPTSCSSTPRSDKPSSPPATCAARLRRWRRPASWRRATCP
jgi:predicted Zn-dependent protease